MPCFIWFNTGQAVRKCDGQHTRSRAVVSAQSQKLVRVSGELRRLLHALLQDYLCWAPRGSFYILFTVQALELLLGNYALSFAKWIFVNSSYVLTCILYLSLHLLVMIRGPYGSAYFRSFHLTFPESSLCLHDYSFLIGPLHAWYLGLLQVPPQSARHLPWSFEPQPSSPFFKLRSPRMAQRRPLVPITMAHPAPWTVLCLLFHRYNIT